MSTSPSWFDQDKFSRLVKKVGTKPSLQPTVAPEAPAPGLDKLPSSLSAPTVTGLLPLSIKAATTAAAKKTGLIAAANVQEDSSVPASPTLVVKKLDLTSLPISKESKSAPEAASAVSQRAG